MQLSHKDVNDEHDGTHHYHHETFNSNTNKCVAKASFRDSISNIDSTKQSKYSTGRQAEESTTSPTTTTTPQNPLAGQQTIIICDSSRDSDFLTTRSISSSSIRGGGGGSGNKMTIGVIGRKASHENFKLIQSKSDDIEVSDHIQFLITEVSAPKAPSVEQRDLPDDVDVVTEGKKNRILYTCTYIYIHII